MTVPIVAFFNNRAGVGKTSLVYHLTWMFRDLGVRVLVADLDPQASLSTAFLGEDSLERIWSDHVFPSIYDAVQPLMSATGDVLAIRPVTREQGLGLMVGDPRLSLYEEFLAEAWVECRAGQAPAIAATTSLLRALESSIDRWPDITPDIVFVDLGSNLGAINRAVLLGADFLVVPLGPDLFSILGLKNLGQMLHHWKAQWAPDPHLPGQIQPIGYVVQQRSVHLDRPVKAYEKWMARIPGEFHRSILRDDLEPMSVEEDDLQCLALLKHYHSLMPMALEANKPMFHLTVADGAIGSHFQAARAVGKDFERLARRIAERVGVRVPQLADSTA